MKKKSLLTLFVLLMSVMLIVPSNAASDDSVMPCWNNIGDIVVELSFSGTEGCATVDVSRIYSVTTSIAGTLTVYKQVGSQWVYVDTISGVSAYSLGLELYFDATSGTTYKALAEVTAYSSTEAESVSFYDIKTCP